MSPCWDIRWNKLRYFSVPSVRSFSPWLVCTKNLRFQDTFRYVYRWDTRISADPMVWDVLSLQPIQRTTAVAWICVIIPVYVVHHKSPVSRVSWWPTAQKKNPGEKGTPFRTRGLHLKKKHQLSNETKHWLFRVYRRLYYTQNQYNGKQEVFFCGSVGGETTVLSFCQGKRISYQAGSAWAERTDIKTSLMDTYTVQQTLIFSMFSWIFCSVLWIQHKGNKKG